MKLSVVIPAHNEAGSIADTLRPLRDVLAREGIPHEIVVVNDNSSDRTGAVLEELKHEIPGLRRVDNAPPNGFGLAVRKGLESVEGDVAAVMMADGSDSPEDLVKFYRKIEEGYDCAFGSRFLPGSLIVDYPKHKLYLNRLVNYGIRMLFNLPYNDVTNAFKMYRVEVLHGLRPYLSHHFNLTVELPLKSIIRGYSYAVVPNSWRNRKAGVSKLKLKEMGSRYLFIVMYIWLEHLLARGDYHRKHRVSEPVKPTHV